MTELEDKSMDDILSIEKLYLRSLQVGNSAGWKNSVQFLDDNQLSSLLLLEKPEDYDESHGNILANKALNTAYLMFLVRSDYERGQLLMRGLRAIIEEAFSSQQRKVTVFEVYRAQALGYYKEHKFTLSIQHLNTAITNCPTIHGNFVDGLSDALIILAESYGALGRVEDALHSSRLAVNAAHERLERIQKENNQAIPSNLSVSGPCLNPFLSVILSYCTLAGQLEKSNTLSSSAAEWFQRALNTARRFNVGNDIMDAIYRRLQLSQPPRFSVDFLLSPMSANMGLALNRSFDVDRKIDTDSNDPWFVPPNSANKVIEPERRPSMPLEISTSARARPRSALPILSRGKHSHGDISDDERIMDSSQEKYTDFGSKSPQTLDVGDHFFLESEAVRPKSALSKLGESYQASPKRMKVENRQMLMKAAVENNGPEAQPYQPTNPPAAVGGPSWPKVARPLPKEISSEVTDFVAPLSRMPIMKMPELDVEGGITSNKPAVKPISAPDENGNRSKHAKKTTRPVHSIILLPSAPSIDGLEDKDYDSRNNKRKSVTRRSHSSISSNSSANSAAQQSQSNLLYAHENNTNLFRPTDLKKNPDTSISQMLHSQSQPIIPAHTAQQQQQQQPSQAQTQQLSASASKVTRLQQLPSRSKSNKTMLSKTLSLSKNQYDQVLAYNNQPAPKNTSNPVLSNSSSQPPPPPAAPPAPGPTPSSAPSTNTAVHNWMLNVDEFGKAKLKKRLSDLYLPYFKGLRIEAKYQASRLGHRGKWYPGRIVRADFLNGLYDVEFENGDKEKNIFVDDIRIPEYASKLALIKSIHNQNNSRLVKDALAGSASTDDKVNSKSNFATAAQIRQQNMEDMHNAVIKIIAGVNQRADARKVERVTLKNTQIVKIQALARGLSTRNHFPRIRDQIIRERELRALERNLRAKEEAIQRFQDQLEENYSLRSPFQIPTITSSPIELITTAIQTDPDPDLSSLPLHLNLEEELISGPYIIDDYRQNYYPSPIPDSYNTKTTRSFREADIQVNETSLATYGHNSMDPNYRLQQPLVQDQSLGQIQDMLVSLQDQQRKLLEYESMRQNMVDDQFYFLQSELARQRDEYQRFHVMEERNRNEMLSEIKTLMSSTMDNQRSSYPLLPEMPTSQENTPYVKAKEEMNELLPKDSNNSFVDDYIQSVTSADLPNFIRSITSVEESARRQGSNEEIPSSQKTNSHQVDVGEQDKKFGDDLERELEREVEAIFSIDSDRLDEANEASPVRESTGQQEGDSSFEWFVPLSPDSQMIQSLGHSLEQSMPKSASISTPIHSELVQDSEARIDKATAETHEMSPYEENTPSAEPLFAQPTSPVSHLVNGLHYEIRRSVTGAHAGHAASLVTTVGTVMVSSVKTAMGQVVASKAEERQRAAAFAALSPDIERLVADANHLLEDEPTERDEKEELRTTLFVEEDAALMQVEERNEEEIFPQPEDEAVNSVDDALLTALETSNVEREEVKHEEGLGENGSKASEEEAVLAEACNERVEQEPEPAEEPEEELDFFALLMKEVAAALKQDMKKEDNVKVNEEEVLIATDEAEESQVVKQDDEDLPRGEEPVCGTEEESSEERDQATRDEVQLVLQDCIAASLAKVERERQAEAEAAILAVKAITHQVVEQLFDEFEHLFQLEQQKQAEAAMAEIRAITQQTLDDLFDEMDRKMYLERIGREKKAVDEVLSGVTEVVVESELLSSWDEVTSEQKAVESVSIVYISNGVREEVEKVVHDVVVEEEVLDLVDSLVNKVESLCFDHQQIVPVLADYLSAANADNHTDEENTPSAEPLFAQPTSPVSHLVNGLHYEIRRSVTGAHAGHAASLVTTVGTVMVSSVKTAMGQVVASKAEERQRAAAFAALSPDIERLVADANHLLEDEPTERDEKEELRTTLFVEEDAAPMQVLEEHDEAKEEVTMDSVDDTVMRKTVAMEVIEKLLTALETSNVEREEVKHEEGLGENGSKASEEEAVLAEACNERVEQEPEPAEEPEEELDFFALLMKEVAAALKQDMKKEDNVKVNEEEVLIATDEAEESQVVKQDDEDLPRGEEPVCGTEEESSEERDQATRDEVQLVLQDCIAASLAKVERERQAEAEAAILAVKAITHQVVEQLFDEFEHLFQLEQQKQAEAAMAEIRAITQQTLDDLFDEMDRKMYLERIGREKKAVDEVLSGVTEVVVESELLSSWDEVTSEQKAVESVSIVYISNGVREEVEKVVHDVVVEEEVLDLVDSLVNKVVSLASPFVDSIPLLADEVVDDMKIKESKASLVEDVLQSKSQLPESKEVDQLLGDVEVVIPYAITLSLPSSCHAQVVYDSQILHPVEAMTSSQDRWKEVHVLLDVLSNNLDNKPLTIRLFSNNNNSNGNSQEEMDKQQLMVVRDSSIPAEKDTLLNDDIQHVLLLELIFSPIQLKEISTRLGWMEYPLLSHSSSVQSAVNEMMNQQSICFLRGSFVRIDFLLRLIVDLWETCMLWMVQTFRLHCQLTSATEKYLAMMTSSSSSPDDEDKGHVSLPIDHVSSFHMDDLTRQQESSSSIRREVEHHHLHSQQQNQTTTATKPNQYLLSMLQDGRDLFVRNMKELNALEKDFEKEVENWELDPRRSMLDARSSGSDDPMDIEGSSSLMEVASESQYAELILSNSVQDLTNRIQHFLQERFVHSRHDVGLGNPIDSEGKDYENYTKLVISTCQEEWSSRWKPLLDEYIVEFFQSLGLLEAVHYHQDSLENTIRSCHLVFDMVLRYIRSYQWDQYWTERDRCRMMLEEPNDFDRILKTAEDVMYAPLYLNSESLVSSLPMPPRSVKKVLNDEQPSKDIDHMNDDDLAQSSVVVSDANVDVVDDEEERSVEESWLADDNSSSTSSPTREGLVAADQTTFLSLLQDVRLLPPHRSRSPSSSASSASSSVIQHEPV
eukprot:gene1624-1764_t